jgi:translation initiation factor IF-1
MMDTKATIDKDGVIIEAIMGGLFRVELQDGKTAVASSSSNIRRNKIRLFPGDKVKVEFTPYDDTRGRIVYKYK